MVLSSPRAIEVSVYVVRAFIQLKVKWTPDLRQKFRIPVVTVSANPTRQREADGRGPELLRFLATLVSRNQTAHFFRRWRTSLGWVINGQATGIKVIPHLGQLPGCGLRTSGCIGQVYWVALAATGFGEVGIAAG